MLAPANWPYVPGEKAMTRADAMTMNRLCQLIAGGGGTRDGISGNGTRNGTLPGSVLDERNGI